LNAVFLIPCTAVRIFRLYFFETSGLLFSVSAENAVSFWVNFTRSLSLAHGLKLTLPAFLNLAFTQHLLVRNLFGIKNGGPDWVRRLVEGIFY